MITRRALMAGAAAMAALPPGASRADAPITTDDGLLRQTWFLESFLELADDLENAHKAGKRFAIMWELKGCPYCRETHLVNFARPDIADYVRSNFEILQLNIIGSRKVTDFDGTELSEKQLAGRYGVRFTPTFQFFPESGAGLAALSPEKREIARIPGYWKPDDFIVMFRFVRQKAYETGSFRDFLKSVRG